MYQLWIRDWEDGPLEWKELSVMYITCLDVEGVLVPEIWIAFAKASNIPELKRTTRMSQIMIS